MPPASGKRSPTPWGVAHKESRGDEPRGSLCFHEGVAGNSLLGGLQFGFAFGDDLLLDVAGDRTVL